MTELTSELVERAMGGERAAVKALVDGLTPVIQTSVARRLLRHRSAGRDVRPDVEDLTQGVLLMLFQDRGRVLRQWDPARGVALRGFAAMIADREVATILRSRRKSPWTEEATEATDLDGSADTAPEPESQAISRELLKIVFLRIREQLSDRGLELFHVLLVEERPTEEVCKEMGMTPEALYAWRSRLGKLAREIAAQVRADLPRKVRR